MIKKQVFHIGNTPKNHQFQSVKGEDGMIINIYLPKGGVIPDTIELIPTMKGDEGWDEGTAKIHSTLGEGVTKKRLEEMFT